MTTLMPNAVNGQSDAQPHVRIDAERCVGCQDCLVRCPTGALSLDADQWIVQADDAACVGCRQCERVCAYSAITVSGPILVSAALPRVSAPHDVLVGNTEELRRGFGSWQEALIEADRCLACLDPTCVRGCPAHNDIPAFIGAIRNRDLTKAHEVLRQTSVLPDICSRVCDWDAQCEGACTWALAGAAPVAIGRLERFVADQAPVPPVTAMPPAARGARTVAVVGSGPGGIAAAWELLAAGLRVTMFDADPRPGGVLRWGIPSYVLPDSLVDRPFEALRAAGLELRSSAEIGRTISLDELRAGFDAVILAHGARSPLSLPVTGLDLPGVEDATSFLNRAKTALHHGDVLSELKDAQVLVVGAGNTAMDVARSVLRQGGNAIAIDWMDERFARARRDELAEARAEGVQVRFGTTLERVEGDADGVCAVWLRQTRQRRAKHAPKLRRGHPQRLPADRVVLAMGYRVDPTLAPAFVSLPRRPAPAPAVPDRLWLASGLLSARSSSVGRLAYDRETALIWSSQPVADRIWVVGDALTGPATVAAAMAHGRDAARAALAALQI